MAVRMFSFVMLGVPTCRVHMWKLCLISIPAVITLGLFLYISNWIDPVAGRPEESNYTGYRDERHEKFQSPYLKSVKTSIIFRLQEIDKFHKDYLIYDCSATMGEGICGGWNDRVTGVINTLMISMITNKKFRLIMNTPCNLSDYFLPNNYEWTVNPEITLRKNISIINLIDERILQLDTKNVGRHFQSSVNLFRNNWDVIDVFRITKNIKDKIPWICKVHHADIYKIIFEILFQPTKLILNPISKLPLHKSKKLVCAHVRIGYNDKVNKQQFAGENRFPFNRINILFEFLRRFDSKSHSIYIATDSPKLKNLSKITFSQNFKDIPGKIMHLGIDNGKDACEGYAKSLRDWWILTKCDVLVLTQSGFGMMAAYLRDNNKPLYCMNTEKLVPCSRYDIIEHYPLEMHIPKYIPISRRHSKTHDYCPPGELQLAKNIPSFLKPLVN